MKLSLGFSTCPNDTFIFDAMVHGKVDTEGLSFELLMCDVEELNKRALDNSVDITKISIHAFGRIAGNYLLLNSGSALGKGNGPLLVAAKKFVEKEIPGLKIAIPGVLTTANLLFSIFYPDATGKSVIHFAAIPDAILSGDADAGVIIHESRFTYREKGLIEVTDLGGNWESLTGLPVPLGGIAVRRTLDQEIQMKIDRVIKRSVEYALNNRESSVEFIRKNAVELNDVVINQHIALYVNDFTVELGIEGRKAVEAMLKKAADVGLIQPVEGNIFVGTK